MANIAADLSLAVSGSSNNLLIHRHGAPFSQSRVLQTRFHHQTRKQNHKRIIFCKSQSQDSVSVRRKNSEIDQSATKLAGASKSEAETATLTATTVSPPPSPTYFGSPLLWVGVGVGISALFSWAAKYVKRYAMQQVFKTMMGQTGGVGINQPGSMPIPQQPGFQFPTPPQQPGYPFPTFTPPVSPKPPVPDVDDSVTDINAQASNNRDTNEMEKEQKRPAFVDVSPEEVSNQKAYVESLEDTKQKETSLEDTEPKETFQNSQNISGADFPVNGGAQSPGSSGPTLSMDALEKMMEDPAVQKMVYPYLPEEMRNPSTFKWMMQNPQYRKQLEDMLNNMSGDAGWDKQMVDTFKNFDLNSQEVKQQFAQVGLTPEEVVSKIMANPDVAMAFQNPRVQAALMDCSQNPMSIAKYQNDKEVMDVFNKISQLFPEMMGSP